MSDALADAGLGPAPPAQPGPASPERSLIDDIVIDRGLVYSVDHSRWPKLIGQIDAAARNLRINF